MKDIVISAKRIKKEGYILLICFILAFMTNIVSIILFKTPWYEIFTQIGYVIVITVTLYLLVAFLRVIIYLVNKLIRR